jgi:hypothetical protein
MNIYILSWAWRSRVSWASSADLVIAACFFGVCVIDYLRGGFARGTLGLVLILALVVILTLNWSAIKLLNQHDQ